MFTLTRCKTSCHMIEINQPLIRIEINQTRVSPSVLKKFIDAPIFFFLSFSPLCFPLSLFFNSVNEKSVEKSSSTENRAPFHWPFNKIQYFLRGKLDLEDQQSQRADGVVRRTKGNKIKTLYRRYAVLFIGISTLLDRRAEKFALFKNLML